MEKRLPFRLLVHLALAGTTVVLATSAAAQTLPMPTLPAPPPTDTGSTTPDDPNQPADTGSATPDEPSPPDEDSLPETARLQSAVRTPEVESSQRWDYTLAAGLGWESNPSLSLLTTTGDYGGSLRARVNRTIRRPTSIFRISGEGVGFLYRDLTAYNRVDGRAALGGSWQLSPRTTAAWGAGVSLDHSDTSVLLSEQGVVLPLTRTINYLGSVTVDHFVSKRTAFRVDGRVFRLDFPESEVFTDSTSIRATASLERRLSKRDSLSAELSAEVTGDARTETTSLWTYYASSKWERLLSPRTAFLVDGGASYTPEYGTAGLNQAWRFYGGVSLHRAIRSRSTVTVFYRREVIPVFGLGGLRLTDRAGLGARVQLGQMWWLALSGTYVRNAAPEEDLPSESYVDGYVSLDRQIMNRLRLSAEGRYYRRGEYGTVPALDDFRAGLFLVLSGP